LHSSFLYASHYHPDLTAGIAVDEHCAWLKSMKRPLSSLIEPSKNDVCPRAGYESVTFLRISAAIRCHVLEPLLSHHDHKRFEVICYSATTSLMN